MKKLPQDVSLIHADGWWTLTFGRYRLQVRACECDLIVCTCRRRSASAPWGRTHHNTRCHAGHAEHMAVTFRRAVRGVKR